MKSKVFLLISVSLLIILIILLIEKPFRGKTSIEKQEQNLELKIGSVAPDFGLADTSDKIVKLSDYKGKKAVIVNFWASWCTACVSEMPMLQEVSQNYKDQLVVLGVNRQESKNDAIKFAYSLGVSFALLLDRNREVNDLYQVINMPVTYFVNKDGIITGFKYGELNKEELYSYIEDML